MLFSLVSNGSSAAPEQPESRIPWWSFTKTVLSAAALTLVRDGRVNLDNVILEGPFTLRQLLRHEAGLADYGDLADYHAAVARNDSPWSADEMLQRLDAGRLRYAPGTGWRYSNVGYLFVARLIERVTDLNLADALTRQVFSPLGLSQVRLATTPADLKDVRIRAYDPGWVYHGLIVGPLGEAALCLDRLLSDHLLPHALRQDMQTVHPLGGPIPGRPWRSPGYGLGLMQSAVQSGRILSGHTGSGPGSVVAVYRSTENGHSATCAVFSEGSDEGAVEARAAEHLSAALENR